MDAPQAFTPPVRIATDFPFVNLKQDQDGNPLLETDDTRKVTINASCELLEHNFPGSFLKADSAHLYLSCHANGSITGWRTVDITPTANSPVKLFDVLVTKSFILISAVSQYGSTTAIKYVMIDPFSLSLDTQGNVDLVLFKSLGWKSIEKNLSSKKVSSLTCALVGSSSSSKQFRAIASIEGTSDTEASNYFFDSNKDGQWEPRAIPTSGEVIHDCQLVSLPGPFRQGFIELIEQSSTELMTCVFQGDGISASIGMKGLGRPRRLHQSYMFNRNGEEFTDLLISSSNGIGFYDHSNMNKEKPLKILGQEIGFKEVFCADQGLPGTETSKLSIFAISDHNELYFFAATRQPKKAIYEWAESSLVPLRTSVTHLAGKLNPYTSLHEVVYTTSNNQEIKYLSRSSENSMWTEKLITSTMETSKQPASTKMTATIVTIGFTDGKVACLPAQYPINIASANPVVVICNGRSYCLDQKPQVIPLNEYGRLVLAIPANDGFSGPELNVGCGNSKKLFNIQTAQRLLHKMSQVKSADDLRNAKSTDGTYVVPESVRNHASNNDKFSMAANFISQLPSSGFSAHSSDASDKTDINVVIAWEKSSEKEGLYLGDTSWFSEAVDGAASIIGDVVEYLKKAVKGVLKLALQVAGPLIRLIIRIGAKVLRFALGTIGQVMNCVLDLLQNILPWDLSALRNWLTFRYKKVEAIQQNLESVFTSSLKLTANYLKTNKEAFKDNIDAIGHYLESYIGRPASEITSNNASSSKSGFFDNPIILALMKFNPISWILETLEEELSSSVIVPEMSFSGNSNAAHSLASFTNVIAAFFDKFRDIIVAAPETLASSVLDSLKTAFWSIFEAFKTALLGFIDILVQSFQTIISFITTEWVIPDFTDLWYDFTNCKFSLMNFFTYILAQFFELFSDSDNHVMEDTSIRSFAQSIEGKQVPALSQTLQSNKSSQSHIMLREQSNATAHLVVTKPKMMRRETGSISKTRKTAIIAVAALRVARAFLQCGAVVFEGVVSVYEAGREFANMEGHAEKMWGPEKILIGLVSVNAACQLSEWAIMATEYDDARLRRESFPVASAQTVMSFLNISLIRHHNREMVLAGLVTANILNIVRSVKVEHMEASNYCEVAASSAGIAACLCFAMKDPKMKACGFLLTTVDFGSALGVLVGEIQELAHEAH